MAVFRFKNFEVDDHGCGMKICSDSVLLGAWFFKSHKTARRILDIGTGSGVLAMIGADICRNATVEAIEIDETAYSAAKKNFAESHMSRRLNAIAGDFAEYLPEEKADLIVSNPPYFTTGPNSGDSTRAIARHQKGLTYETLLRYSANNLKPEGCLGFIAPAEFEDEIIFHAEIAGLKINRLCRVETSKRKAPTRILIDCSKSSESEERGILTISSPEYIALVDDLYLKI